MWHREYALAIPASLVALALGCAPRADTAKEKENEQASAPTEPEARRAVAELEGKSGSSVSGEAFFVQKGPEVGFGIRVENATPGSHAVHVHETGDCSAEDASSAGEHWNPTRADHGAFDSEAFHLGDIGNIEVGPEGSGVLNLTTDRWSLGEMNERSVVGKAIVVHSGADDFETQPDGGAGTRVACGVIEWKDGT